ncbi:MAG: alanine dehydrogenase [Candidatus Heimdallarchaeota archaeon]|nr:alanine dehydrogenase [Candidatus Heimdallarchaeota archaeon]
MKIIGVPKEVKNGEFRIGLTPESVKTLKKDGHTILVEHNGAKEIGFYDEEYISVGAEIIDDCKEIYEKSDIIVKVKEPQKSEYNLIKKDQIIFTYLHLAAEKELTNALLQSGCTAIAYETITDQHGHLPLLLPMSQIAGRLSVLVGAKFLQKGCGKYGILLSEIAGVEAAKVTIIGGGIAGTNAANYAIGLGANVAIFDKSLHRIEELKNHYGMTANILHSNHSVLEKHVIESDLVIGAVLIPGLSAPRVVSESTVKKMKKGSVIVDIAIDQGGCIETSKPTTHDNPINEQHGVLHYGVMNMPSLVAKTAALALNNYTLPFVQKIANSDNILKTMKSDKHLANGLNVYSNQLICEAVGKSLNISVMDIKDILNKI